MLAYLDTIIGFAVIMLGASLLITIITQLVSTLLSHRGANLRWGLETMFKNLPASSLLNDAKTAARVAEDVLTHPLISDSIFSLKPQWLGDRIRLATALSPDELIAILGDLATKPAYVAVAGLPAEIATLINARSLALERRLTLLKTSPALAGLPAETVGKVMQDSVSTLANEAGEVEAWFNSTMDRVSARFTTYMRLWTIATALALAFGTGLNSVTLLNGLYSNGAFRQSVVGSATQMTDLADRVLANGPKDAVSKMYTDTVTKALADSGAQADATPSGVDSETAARTWMTAHVAEGAQRSSAVSALDKALADQRLQDAAQLRTILTDASFDVRQFRWNQSQPWWPQVPGVLVTAALLSLGAPFWFNTLKQLAGMRPILANKQDSK